MWREAGHRQGSIFIQTHNPITGREMAFHCWPVLLVRGEERKLFAVPFHRYGSAAARDYVEEFFQMQKD
jgi:hypothetical protein